MSRSYNPRMRTFVRSLIIGADAEPSFDSWRRYAEGRWGQDEADVVLRAMQSALTAANLGAPNPIAQEFFDLVRDRSVFGRLESLRRVPFGVRMMSMVTGSTGYWVGESNPKPVSKPTLSGSSLKTAKVAGLVVQTREALQRGGNVAEDAIIRDMQGAVTDVWDLAFLDATNAGVADERPASITNGAPTIASTGDAVTDIGALIAAFDGDLSAAAFVSDPKTAAQLALANGGTAFPDAGPRGGSLVGLPLITSRTSPRDTNGGQIALVDASGIAAADEGLRMSVSNQATLQMRDDPVDGPTNAVSLFQTNSVAFLAEVVTNWEVQREGSVVVLTGADYPQGS